jgi:hypothetical protein
MHVAGPFRAFSSQVETLGGSENATKQAFRASCFFIESGFPNRVDF